MRPRHLPRQQHVNEVARYQACAHVLRHPSTDSYSIRRSVPRSTLSTLISSFVMSKLDYCNVALAGLPSCNLDNLQSVINAATCLSVGEQHNDHITPLLADLNWLRIPQHIQYKLCILVYQSVQGSAPSYLQNAICRSQVRNHSVACAPRHRPISSRRRRNVQQWATAPSQHRAPETVCPTRSAAAHLWLSSNVH